MAHIPENIPDGFYWYSANHRSEPEIVRVARFPYPSATVPVVFFFMAQPAFLASCEGMYVPVPDMLRCSKMEKP